jgi:hypothetical protein
MASSWRHTLGSGGLVVAESLGIGRIRSVARGVPVARRGVREQADPDGRGWYAEVGRSILDAGAASGSADPAMLAAMGCARPACVMFYFIVTVGRYFEA